MFRRIAPPRLFFVVLGSLFTLALSFAARAEYPERPIRLIVPQAAGSASDNLARVLAAALSQQMGQQVVVDNRPGGALTIGMDIVAKSAADGYTLALGPVGALAITRHMVGKLPYDIERDFHPVALISYGHLVLATSPVIQVKSVRELIDYAKKNPGKLTNASSSNGSPGHVSGELFKYMTGTDIVHVPYKGGAQAINDLMAGHVQVMFESLNSMAAFVRSGKVRGLAVSGAKRSAVFPELPTLNESGVPGYDVTSWSGLVAPTGVPRAIVDRLNAEVNKAINSPAYKDKFEALGSEGGGGTPEAFADLIRKDSAKWADVIKRSGAKID